MYTVFVVIVVFATLAMMVQHGVWNNLLNLMAIVMGGLIAFGVHQPLVVMLDEWTDGSYTYLIDFPVLWMTFALATGVIKQLANSLSKNRVNFPERVDGIGGAVIGLVAGWVMACFTMATFYTAPLGKDLMGGAYDHGDTPSAVQQTLDESSPLTKPDFAWLALTGAVLEPASFGSAGFSPKIFIQQHTAHRAKFQELDTNSVRRR